MSQPGDTGGSGLGGMLTVAAATEGASARGQSRRPRVVPWGRLGGRLGLLIVGFGLLVIGLGWNGASGSGGEINRVPAVAAQLPWLLSGGFLGLGIVLVGVALLITQAHREDRIRLEARLEDLIAAVERGQQTRAPADVAGLVVAGTSSFHEPNCRLARGRGDASVLTPAEATSRGLTPCRICTPVTLVGGDLLEPRS